MSLCVRVFCLDHTNRPVRVHEDPVEVGGMYVVDDPFPFGGSARLNWLRGHATISCPRFDGGDWGMDSLIRRLLLSRLILP